MKKYLKPGIIIAASVIVAAILLINSSANLLDVSSLLPEAE